MASGHATDGLAPGLECRWHQQFSFLERPQIIVSAGCGSCTSLLLLLLKSQKCLDRAHVSTFLDQTKLVLPSEHVFICQLIFREPHGSNAVVLGVLNLEPLTDVLDSVPAVAPVLFGWISLLCDLDRGGACSAKTATLAPRISKL